MLKFLSGLSAALLICACQISAPRATEQEAPPLRLAAWNMEHLTAEPGAGCMPRDEAGLDLVADYITRVDADIWLLQEVDGEAALARVFGEGWTFHVEDRGPAGDYPLCRGREDGARLRAQNTAIAVRDGILHERLPDLSALDLAGDRRTRYGVAINLPGAQPVDILSVHLASGCFAGESSDRCPALFAQAQVLEDWIDTRSAAGHAVIVGGDFNRRLETAGDPVWARLNDGVPTGLHIAGAGTGPSCNPRYTDFIDFLVLNDAAFAGKRAGSFRETTYDPGDQPSDHCPISVELAP
ncbi:hypothetical protein BBF93_06790 [Hyphomonas sp. CACIAM 19H1]|uniref:endonuclease/exonuclease/phosphatase family protein n=1 Tax=Hyphomonas sp. CACIAM 19H1 TaxID=1873716 RepID=UPI000DF09845|nr:endonuclease/exonuclease/phosphatase family protein [Hyphomonas sp. CACIAM 19H1]AXE63958.1 hypothetical protein BBF93_06790 [Hyphomonas sp. CACIAM 19H1]